MLAASFALALSPTIPFMGPIGAVRVGRVNGQWVGNPTHAQQEASDLDLVVAGTADSIMMVEAGAQFVSEADLVAALDYAHAIIREQVKVQLAFAAQCGVPAKAAYVPDVDVAPLDAFVEAQCRSAIEAACKMDKEPRKEALALAKTSLKAAVKALPEDHAVSQVLAAMAGIDVVSEAFKRAQKQVVRARIVNEGIRPDGRKTTEIRSIKCDVGVLPRVHGSALFTRGSTQALSICTLGAPGDAQRLDGVDPLTEKRWLHHYAFPSYSVGEVRPNRGPGRREIGHGALAERAVAASLPTQEVFPYVMRVNSEIMESNGSSSMASTCGATLALMDAGVPLTDVVGGIAMGLIKEGSQNVILSDILGEEDFLGDMDFKVTGSAKGITALQMDIKVQGISVDIIRNALAQAREGRLHILGKMAEAIEKPRTSLSPFAPRIITLNVGTDMIGTVIGPGGKMIRSIIERTGATIDIQDDGTVLITASDERGEEARKIIEDLTRRIEAGMMIKGTVVSMIAIGAFVQIAPGRDGMIHISQFPYRIPAIDCVFEVGDEVLVRVVDVDDRGRINLTLRDITDEQRAEVGLAPFPKLEDLPEPKPQPEGGEERGGFRGGRDRDRGPRGGGGGFRR